MGVPALFRWLSKKYPKIVTSVQEEEPRSIPGPDGQPVELPIEMRNPNPNGEEFDCLYLDMNGIVHPCTHPEGKEAPSSEEEMMLEVFSYTERVVNMVRPRKLLMMAIDGVAPRAKMNQQRSRRFRSAQEANEKREDKIKALAEWKAMGLPISDEAATLKEAWDSNNITPGTPFMDLLAASLRYWVSKKIQEDEGWKDLKVIISDASVPGEGEHKIMEFIRRQRSHDEHDPNTKHVIYGLDADLIMLSLATHEPYFKVLREDVFASDNKRGPPTCNKCQKEGHIAANCISEPLPPSETETKVEKKPFNAPADKKPFIFLDVSVLREYLEVELDVPGLPFNFDLERAIDDWVFLIFFVGNDFLPHLPSLEIREGAIDTLLKIWKEELPRSGGYLTKHGSVELKSAQVIMEGLASHEDEIFKKRKELEGRMESNQKRRKTEEENRQRRENGEMDGSAGDDKDGNTNVIGEGYVEVKVKNPFNGSNHSHFKEDNRSAAEILKAELKSKKKGNSKEEESTPNKIEEIKDEKMENGEEEKDQTNGRKRKQEFDDEESSSKVPALDSNQDEDLEAKAEEIQEDEEASVEGETEPEVISTDAVKTGRTVNADGTVTYEDTVKLWEPGYRERYYRQKFGIELSDVEFRKKIVKSYVEGLCWVLAYYYQGCPSWQWYYPYHYSPFAADFTEIEELEINFTLGKPFKPFEQLMGVFPAASRFSIPEAFRSLMTDEESAIIDYYPVDFQIDMNGKKMAWQGVALLPFIDQTRLLDALNTRYTDLSEDENRRNSFGNDVMFVSEESRVYDSLCKLYAKRKNQKDPIPLDANLTGGISGFVKPDPDCIPGSSFPSPLTKVKIQDISNPNSISVLYDFPEQLSPHRSVMLQGVKQPKKVLTEGDRDWTRRGGPDSRGRGGGRGGSHRGSGRGHSYQGPGVINHNSMRFGNGPVNPNQQYGIPNPQGGHYNNYGYQAQRPVNAYSNPSASNPYAPQHNQYQSQPNAYGGAGNAYSAPQSYSSNSYSQHNSYPSSGYGGYGSSSSSLPSRAPPPHQQSHSYQNQQYPSPPTSNYPPSNYGSSYGSSGYGGYGAAPPPVNPYGYSAPPPSTNQSYGGYGNSNPYGYGQPPAQNASYGAASLPARPRPLGFHNANNNGDPTRPSRGRGRGRGY